MGLTATPTAPTTTEQKIVAAAAQSAQIVQAFSPAAAQLIAAGVSVEPIIGGLIQMFAALFAHHAQAAVAGK